MDKFLKEDINELGIRLYGGFKYLIDYIA